MVVANLLARQQRIVDGSSNANVCNIVGVSIRANQETIDSVPYLTHLDYVKGVKEMAEVSDYVALDLT
jgi:hypothetical protein